VEPKLSKIHYGWIVVVVGMLAVTGAVGLARFGYTMILPSMQDSLRLNYSQMGLLATGNFIGYLSFTLVGGLLATKYGPRIIVALSMLLASISLALTGMAWSFESAFMLRMLTGIGSGGANVPAMSLSASWFTSSRRGTAAGIMAAGCGIGLIATGIAVPNILLSFGSLGWRYSWYCLGIAALAISLLCYILIRNRPEEKGLSQIGSSTAKPIQSVDEGESESSLRWSLVYRNPALMHLGLVYFMYGFTYIVYATFFAAYLVKEVGLTAAGSGLLWTLAGFLSIFSGLIWGGFSDFAGRKYGLAAVYLVLALSFFTFTDTTNMFWLYLSAILFGVAAWAIPTIMAAAAGDYVGPRLAPAALGFITTTFFGVGQATGPYVAGYVKDMSGSFIPAFMLSGAVAVVGLILALALRKAS